MTSDVALKELRKWLMDVAKYVATAVILSNVFSGLQGKAILITGMLCVGIAVLCGIILINLSEKRKKTMTWQQ